jgi:hypothetical protein
MHFKNADGFKCKDGDDKRPQKLGGEFLNQNVQVPARRDCLVSGTEGGQL